ncbi:MAG: NAD(P)-dependent oxidoreductase [Actinomycetota bacterium]
MDKNLRILITGASGLVGSSILGKLSALDQFEIIVVTGKRSITTKDNNKRIDKFYQVDISDEQTFGQVEELKAIDILIHAAGLAHQFGDTEKKDFWRVNVKGVKNICKLAVKLQVKHFLLISSVAVYGNYGKTIVDETFKCQPRGFYAESKLEGEKIAIEICEKKKIALTIFRLGTVIGEGDHGNVSRLMTIIDKGRFYWIGNGENKKSLIYKEDVAEAVLSLIKNKKNGTEIFNLSAEPITMREIVDSIAENLCKKLPRIRVSNNLLQKIFRFNEKSFKLDKLIKLKEAIQKWISDDIYAGQKLFEKYSFKPLTTISGALEKQVKFYLSTKRKQRVKKVSK